MLAFPEMIVPAAKKAGMKVPKDANDFDSNKYPHFCVFCIVQLCRPMLRLDEHWNNAKIIAAIPEDKIRTVTLEQLLAKGLGYAQ